MKSALILAAGLLLSAPAFATPGWDEPSNSPFPQAELSYGAIPTASQAERREAVASAALPGPNGSGNLMPNGSATANPPGAGASSSATLEEHGEVGTGTIAPPGTPPAKNSM